MSQENPPDLDQSWRESDSNKSLGLLMDRTASQCYYDLNKLLTEMSELPSEPQQQQPIGVIPHTGHDTSENSLKRKRMLMEWANNQRDRFIKTLVLSDWCRNEPEKARLIDVKVWQDKQNFAHRDCTQAVANTKNNMIPAKMPNPNIEGAMEVLATGKASWVPDLGYIPPKALTPKQILRTLQDMNVLLATRLNLHEDLPPHFADFTIADGRATFTVQDEFEVDLAVADEEPTSQFFFIDIRMRFSPAAEVIDDRLRPAMEATVNDELSKKGLKGCYEFLHSFVLTHKINVLKSQATEMIRGKWFDCIRIESFRRRLMVQYWAGMPGAKSWIEIGVHSGKRKGYQFKPPTPRLAVRWFRRGVEVTDETVEFDWKNLDLEKSLSMVVAKHTAWLMRDLQKRIQNLAPNGSPFQTSVLKEDTELDTDALSLSLPSLRHPLQVHVELVTGQFAILPPSPATSRTERRLNNDAKADAAVWLAGLPPAVVRERARKEAELLDWSETRDLSPQDNLKAVFGQTVQQLLIFRPTQAWGESWALAVTFSLAGEKYWTVSLQNKRDHEGKVLGKTIASATHVSPPEATSDNATISSATLLEMEQAAVAHVAFTATASKLKTMKMPCALQNLPSKPRGEEPRGQDNGSNMALFIRFSSLMRDSQNQSQKPWADEIVRLTHHGIEHSDSEDSAGNVRHDLRLSLKPGKMKQLQKHISRSKDRDMVMNSEGGLALKFLTPFGESFVEQMKQKLRTVERLETYLTVLEESGCKCTHVSLSRLDFSYGKGGELSASVSFSPEGRPTKLRLSPQDGNPHQRIRVQLEQDLGKNESTAFKAVVMWLATTLTLMQTFDKLEAKAPAKKTISIYVRSSTHYTVKYEAPLPNCVFEIKAIKMTEQNRSVMRWKVWDLRPGAKDGALSEELTKGFKELCSEKGEHWLGVGNAIAAESQGVSEAVEKLDDIIRRSPAVFEPSSAKPADTKKTEDPEPPTTQAAAAAGGQSATATAPAPAPAKPQANAQEPAQNNQQQKPAQNAQKANNNANSSAATGNGSKKQPIALD